jgi:hypothetical protein
MRSYLVEVGHRETLNTNLRLRTTTKIILAGVLLVDGVMVFLLSLISCCFASSFHSLGEFKFVVWFFCSSLRFVDLNGI